MLVLTRVVLQLALGLWLGAVVFCSFVVAPTVFSTVPAETAGIVMGGIFPRYYAFTAAVGVVALGAALLCWRARRETSRTATVILLAVMLLSTTYAGAVVHPQARALRPLLHQEPVSPDVRIAFDRLHRRAVQLNGLVLLLGLAAIVVTAVAPRR